MGNQIFIMNVILNKTKLHNLLGAEDLKIHKRNNQKIVTFFIIAN